MKLVETPLPGVFVLEPKVFGDERGFFVETYSERIFKEKGLVTNWKQDNWSLSQKGVLRGLHMQKAPHAQTKLVRVLRGSVFDVAVDVRPESPTFGRWHGVELSAANKLALYIPAGFAHGFQALEDDTHFVYKCDDVYHPEAEMGYMWDDPRFGIRWPLASPVLSAKDTKYSYLSEKSDART
jgi:dTDP-4-dehydrorhamnose 3,5-epimerase